MTEEVFSVLSPIPCTKATRPKVRSLLRKLYCDAKIRFYTVKAAAGVAGIGFHADSEVTWKDREGPIDDFLYELGKYLEDGHVVTYTETRVVRGVLDNGEPAPTVVTTFVWMASKYAVAGYTLDDLVDRAKRSLPKTENAWRRRLAKEEGK